MDDAKRKPTANGPHRVHIFNEDYRKGYINNTLDKFLDEYVFQADKNKGLSIPSDGVWCYSINMLKSYLLLADIKNAVATGNGEYLTIMHKQLLIHFFATPGFSEFAIEMLINILQCHVLLSIAEAQ